MPQFKNVAVVKRANVYFDGKCISHTVILDDGSKKTIGVILPGTYTFNTNAPELMEIIEGRCVIKVAGDKHPSEIIAGQGFNVPGNSSFDIEVSEELHYVCHFD
ncbi:pyrimidine/purine nucleoside phosphorylase [Andreprevotia chitinilytica]|uniref:pyrimidine/purine nucleoside phosphorylase n=1 Tax=Andreprevotia chitinilytica TaxID=396808 RepID=UPI0005560171|nr:pyrimidine/purine nucleoside phosphorylase [Andreprevotia chitinilytica]